MNWIKSSYFRIPGLIITALLLIFVLEIPTLAQEPPINQWSPQQRIPEYDDEAGPPYLVADQNRSVHAFHSQTVDGVRAIVYRQWSVAEGWTTPVDILLPPEKRQARIMGVSLDQHGMLHVIFFSGDDLNANIYYSRAPAIKAGRAGAWSTPKVIGEDAVTPNIAALESDGKNNLFVVYSGEPEGKGLYAVHSSDAGDTWSTPVPVFLTYDDLLSPWALRLELDDEERPHAVWTINSSQGNGEAVYYANFPADHKQWSDPVVLAEREGDEYEADWASIASYSNELFVVYNDSSPATRWMRRSQDGGQTWSEPMKPFPSEGEYGHPVFLIDGNNVLHLLLGNRRGEIHGMWHSAWEGGRWRDLEPVVSGRVSRVPGKEFDPTLPQGVVSQGNVLLVAWETDNGVGNNGAWYSYLVLDIPASPVMPLPTVASTPSIMPTQTSTPPLRTPAPRHERAVFQDSSAIRTGGDSPIAVASNPTSPLITAIVPVVLLISLLVLIQRLFRRNHY